MLKIVTPELISRIEKNAYAHGYSESLFMDYAGTGVAHIVEDYLSDFIHQIRWEKEQAKGNKDRCDIMLLCGKGNNGGDAYIAGIRLLEMEYSVSAIQVGDLAEASPLCRKNWETFHNSGGKTEKFSDELRPPSKIIIDGLFGTGFHGTLKDPYASIIQWANHSGVPILSIDIPSGLNGTTGEVGNVAIHANITAFLGYPKTGFFFRDGRNHTGLLQRVDFGLPENLIEIDLNNGVGTGYLLTSEGLKSKFPRLVNNRHKYQAGYVVSLAGSRHMPGAAILASMAALKAGAGIVRLIYPAGMEIELASAPYELIKQPYNYEDLDPLFHEIQRAHCVIIGPGIGLTEEVDSTLRKVFSQLQKPCVLDADALTLHARNPYPLPPNTILTPHKGEMLRLLQDTSHNPESSIDIAFLERCQVYADKHRVTILLKGAPTFILHPETPYFVSHHGDPGMATAGSGDVLTGVVAALLAQGVEPRYAAALSAHLHGLAGEQAAARNTSYCMTASDILAALPSSFVFFLR